MVKKNPFGEQCITYYEYKEALKANQCGFCGAYIDKPHDTCVEATGEACDNQKQWFYDQSGEVW
jgi:hypothetical protein